MLTIDKFLGGNVLLADDFRDWDRGSCVPGETSVLSCSRMVGPESLDFLERLVVSTSCGKNLRGSDPNGMVSTGLKTVSVGEYPGEDSPEGRGALAAISPLVVEISPEPGWEKERGRRGRRQAASAAVMPVAPGTPRTPGMLGVLGIMPRTCRDRPSCSEEDRMRLILLSNGSSGGI